MSSSTILISLGSSSIWMSQGSCWVPLCCSEPLVSVSSLEMQGQVFSLVAQSCLTLCDPVDYSTPGLLVYHQLRKFTQTHVHWVGAGIQPSHPLPSPSPLAPNPSQHQSLFQWVNSLHHIIQQLYWKTIYRMDTPKNWKQEFKQILLCQCSL